LRHCAASRKVAGSILDDVDSASDRNEYQEYFLVGKGCRCVSVTTFHFHVPIFYKYGSLNLLELHGTVKGLHRDCFTFAFYYILTVCD